MFEELRIRKGEKRLKGVNPYISPTALMYAIVGIPVNSLLPNCGITMEFVMGTVRLKTAQFGGCVTRMTTRVEL
jgi:hypothetical protein